MEVTPTESLTRPRTGMSFHAPLKPLDQKCAAANHVISCSSDVARGAQAIIDSCRQGDTVSGRSFCFFSHRLSIYTVMLINIQAPMLPGETVTSLSPSPANLRRVRYVPLERG
jgi:hypothetical protein